MTGFVDRRSAAQKFADELAREVRDHPVLTFFLLMAHAAFLGFLAGRCV